MKLIIFSSRKSRDMKLCWSNKYWENIHSNLVVGGFMNLSEICNHWLLFCYHCYFLFIYFVISLWKVISGMSSLSINIHTEIHWCYLSWLSPVIIFINIFWSMWYLSLSDILSMTISNLRRAAECSLLLMYLLYLFWILVWLFMILSTCNLYMIYIYI